MVPGAMLEIPVGNAVGDDGGDDGGGESKGVLVVDDASSVEPVIMVRNPSFRRSLSTRSEVKLEGGSISNNPAGECASAMYGEAARNGLKTGRSAEVTDKGRSISVSMDL